MRCSCCDKLLTDFESSVKSVATGEYLDSCIKCIRAANIQYVGNVALKQKNVYEEAWKELSFENGVIYNDGEV